MAGETVYADLNLSPGFPGSRAPLSALPLGPQSPRWHSTALWVSGIGNIVLAMAVVALGIWGGAGCKLCPMDWRQRGDKCYWVSTGMKTWDESHSDCTARGSQLLVIRDREELVKGPGTPQLGLPLWGSSLGTEPKGYIRYFGQGPSPLSRRLPVSGPAEGSSCGAVKGNRLHSQGCSSTFQWVCQRDAVPL
ncbi:killer cell lectin-like receptor subfamily B member 1B allele B [Pelodiscus sinensis]|uniref:killer cell lectin-like receptor subfamily B member 1B allele B n=1 Tax=Pelodiscus sinensis TaxID=13735 RepID=UPI003F6C15D7